MAYESYADEIYYKNVYGGDVIADEFLNKAPKTASRHIDTPYLQQDCRQGYFFVDGISAGYYQGIGLQACGF